MCHVVYMCFVDINDILEYLSSRFFVFFFFSSKKRQKGFALVWGARRCLKETVSETLRSKVGGVWGRAPTNLHLINSRLTVRRQTPTFNKKVCAKTIRTFGPEFRRIWLQETLESKVSWFILISPSQNTSKMVSYPSFAPVLENTSSYFRYLHLPTTFQKTEKGT